MRRHLFTMLAAVAAVELYLLFRPSNLTEQIDEWLTSLPGRFESYYAEHHRGDNDGG